MLKSYIDKKGIKVGILEKGHYVENVDSTENVTSTDYIYKNRCCSKSVCSRS